MQRGCGGPPETAAVAQVPRDVLAACMTCAICHKLLRNATTISECLHSFCRDCIYDKVEEENLNCCPVCNVNLLPLPFEKFRTDHNLQDLREKIFPFKRRKVDAPDVPSSISLPIKRKKISLSSLVCDTPHVVRQSGPITRSKVAVKKAATLNGPSPDIDESTKREGCNIAVHVENSSSPESLSCMTVDRMQVRSLVGDTPHVVRQSGPITRSKAAAKKTATLNRPRPDSLSCMTFDRMQNKSNEESFNWTSKKDTENGGDSFMDKSDLSKPLSCLFEAAHRSKAVKSSPQCPVVIEEQIDDSRSQCNIPKTKTREPPHKPEFQDCKSDSISLAPTSVKTRSLQRASCKEDELGTSAQALLDVGVGKHGRIIEEQIDDSRSKCNIPKMKTREPPHKPEVQDCKIDNISIAPTLVKTRSLQRASCTKDELGTSAQAPLDAGVGEHGRIIEEQIDDSRSECNIPKMKTKEPSHEPEVQDCKIDSFSMAPTSVKTRSLQRASCTKYELGTSAQAPLAAGVGKHGRRISPIWFSLISASDQKGDAQLPQISGRYLRIQDGNLPVSFIQKYLVKKLNLRSEAEVEIKCRDQPVGPTMALHSLLDLWKQTGSSNRVQASVGTPAKDFVMVLSYARKTLAS